MRTLYELSRYKVWTGKTTEIEDAAGWDRKRWTPKAPPSLGPNQWAQLRGHVWVVMDEPLNIYDQQREARRLHGIAMERLVAAHGQALVQIESRYPLAEKLGWHRLEKAVEAFRADGTVTAGLAAYCTATGLGHEEAVERIEGAVEAYDVAYGEATGTLTRLRDEADAALEALDLEALEGITWPETEEAA